MHMGEHNYTTGNKLTYREFAQYAVRLAAGLIQLGVGSGDTVVVGGKPSGSFLPTGLAVLLTGAAFSPIESRCGKAIDGIELTVEAMVSRQSHLDVESFEPAPVCGQTDVALIVYSSGTTGLSKGVLLTHLNCIIFVYGTVQRYRELPFNQPLEVSFFSDPDHTSCYDICMMAASICAGQTLIYPENDALGFILEIVQDFKVDTMPTVSLVVDMMVKAEKDKYDLSSLKVVVTTGSMLTPQNVKLFQERYPNVKLINAYGASEVSGVAVCDATSFGFEVANKDTDAKGSCVGRAGPGLTIKIVDVETRAPLGPNQRGEICVRGPNVMKGYLGAPTSLDEEGFYPTGDLGYYDDQKLFYVTSRLKDVICYFGYKIFPGDIEAVLQQHPAVQEAAVVGKPTEVEGEDLPAAFVVIRPGAAPTEAELVDYVAQQVTWSMQLRGGVRFVSELPRNARRKVLRHKLKEMLTEE